MTTGVNISTRVEIPRVGGLMVYLLGLNGSDVLEFKDNEEARRAATTLRVNAPGIAIEARYNKVFLRIQG